MNNFSSNKDLCSQFELIFGYKFANEGLLLQAFTRSSYANDQDNNVQSGEILEFLGDSVLNICVSDILIEKTCNINGSLVCDCDEGDLTKLRIEFVNKNALSSAIENLELNKFLIVGKADAFSQNTNEISLKEDLFESIIGAIYLDCGKNLKIVKSLIDTHLAISKRLSSQKLDDLIESISKHNYKGILQEKAAKDGKTVRYKRKGETGKDHKKLFVSVCLIDNTPHESGTGKTLKESEQSAAKNTLAKLFNT